MSNIPHVHRILPEEAKPGDQVRVLGDGLSPDDVFELWDEGKGELEKRLSSRSVRVLSPSEAEVALPKRLHGGRKEVVIVRQQMAHRTGATLDIVPLVSQAVAAEGTELTLRGHGFTSSSRVTIGDLDLVPTDVGPEHISFRLPRDVPLEEVLSPSVSTPAWTPAPPLPAAPAPAMDTIPVPLATTDFRVDRDGFSFPNSVEDQAASWGTFVETFGETEIRSAARLPTFLFLWAYYALYTSFFEGIGPFQASGLCTGLAVLCLERFCAGASPNISLPLTREVRQQLTVRMGRILGRKALVTAYEQCKAGLANIPPTLNKLQASLQGGIRADSAQLLWFLPSGRITERKFMEQLASAHSVVPYAILFTITPEASRWRIPIYDVNMPNRGDVWVQVEQRGREWSWFHNKDNRFTSSRGMTLAAMPLQLFLEKAEFPFSGPFGLTRFLYDMLV